MTTHVRRCRVDEQGNVVIPLGLEEAGADVEVVIRPAGAALGAGKAPMTREEWIALIERTSGSIDDPDFGRPPQPALPKRGWNE